MGKLPVPLQRNHPLQESLRSSLLKQIDLISPGGIWLRNAPGIRVDSKRFYPTLEKIVRGLYRHHTGRYLPPATAFNWAINEPLHDERRKLFQLSTPGLSYSDVFEYRFGTASEDNIEMTVWWFRFFKKLVMRCLTRIENADSLGV